jgi:RNA polymerase subunit RPABC4/transcription elongation factor Spt4
MSERMTGAEQADFVPPPCPKCGSTDTEAYWLDSTSMIDDERYFVVNGYDCNGCHGQ